MWLLLLASFGVAVLTYLLAQPGIPADYYLTIEEKALKDGYTPQTYNVTTKDGFVLSLYRLKNEGAPAVLLLHGFACSPESFMFNFYTKPVAYQLVDSGFDVWLAASRGNVHSRQHLWVGEGDSEFWDWTTTEMALLDGPALVEAVGEVAGTGGVRVLGHSQGGTMALMALATYPWLRGKVPAVALLASPPGRIPSLPLPTQFFDPPAHFLVALAHYFPIVSPLIVPATFNPGMYGEGWTYAVVSSAKAMGGTSLKNLEYVRQLALPRENVPFAFDFGPSRNYLIYGRATPPAIDYSSINVPTAYFGGNRDEFVCEWEMGLMKELLGEGCRVFRTDLEHDHMGMLLSGKLEYVGEVVEFFKGKEV